MEEFYKVYDWLATEDGQLHVWGIFTRLMGLMLIVSLGPLTLQLPALASSKGLVPYTRLLKAYWRDFGVRALWKFPSVYHISLLLPVWLSDLLIVVFPLAACISGLLLALGVGYTPYLAIFNWVMLLSVDQGVSGLIYPWDSLLIESSFLTIFLPALKPICSGVATNDSWLTSSTHALSGVISVITGDVSSRSSLDLRAERLPSPLLSFAFRYLIFRVLVGFGKIKFMDTTDKDRLYIKYFLINQPIVTPLGLIAQRILPNLVWVFSLVVMFIVEIPLPFCAFFEGLPRLSFAIGCIALMVGIQISGNYGYFNVVTSILCVPLFDHSASVWNTTASTFSGWTADSIFAYIALGYIFPASLLYFVGNSWINLSWTHWPTLKRTQPVFLFNHVVSILRALSQFRIVQGYGVFPPNSAPPQRWIVQYEVSDDNGRSWNAYALPHVAFAPTVVAPHHPRIDHAIFYESLGMNGCNFIGPLVSGSSHQWSFTSFWVRMQLLLARAAATGETAISNPVLSIFYSVPQVTSGVLLKDGSRMPIPSDIQKQLQQPSWRKVGSSPLVRVALVNAVPVSLSTWFGRCIALLRGNANAPSSVYPLGAHARPGSAPASAAPLVGLVGKMQLAAWDFKRAATHLAPISAYNAWEDVKTGKVFVLPDEYLELLDHNAVVSGPEHYWWDYAFNRIQAGHTQQRLTEQSVNRFWDFVQWVRKEAVTEAKSRLESPRPASKFQQPTPVRGHVYLVNDIVGNCFGKVPTPQDDLRGATRAAAKDLPGVDNAFESAVANPIFVWDALPGIAKRMFHKYSESELDEIRCTYNMLCLPVLRVCERIFWRAAPTKRELEEEWARGYSADTTSQVAGDSIRELFMQTDEMISGSAEKQVPQPATFTLDTVTYHRIDFREQDASVAGAMKNHVRFGLYASWLMLVGGRRAFERAACADKESLLNRQLPTHNNGSDYISTASTAHLFARLVSGDAALHPGHMTSESGSFLLAMLNYDMFATLAQKAKMMGVQGRPASGPIKSPPAALPGFLEMMQRMSLHDNVLPWDHTNQCFIDPVDGPRWGLDVSDGSWHLISQ